jgi:hypothetical protein
MKISPEILDSMRAETSTVGSLTKIRQLLQLFVADESGRGLTKYGIVIAVLLLIAGLVYGHIRNQMPMVFGCSGCGMG